MKKIKLLLFISLIGIFLAACDSDINEVVMSSDPTEPALSNLALSGDFNLANANGLITFSWTAADFGFASSTTYVVEVSPASDFSANVATLVTTQTLQGTAKVNDINNLLLTWNKAIGTAATVYYRVSASVTAANIVYSETKSNNFVPFETIVDYPMIYVPGAYQGWSPGADNGRLFSYGFNSEYYGIVRISDGVNENIEFKVTSDPDWNHTNWGGTLTQSGTNYSGTLDASGGNLSVAAGTYIINVNVNSLAITLSKTDDWGIIGGSIPPYDWSVDVDMFYNGQRKMWEITGDFKGGDNKFKFRANNDWAVNYGDNGADGTLEAGGADIALPSDGNYTIRFDPVALTYTVKKN